MGNIYCSHLSGQGAFYSYVTDIEYIVQVRGEDGNSSISPEAETCCRLV